MPSGTQSGSGWVFSPVERARRRLHAAAAGAGREALVTLERDVEALDRDGSDEAAAAALEIVEFLVGVALRSGDMPSAASRLADLERRAPAHPARDSLRAAIDARTAADVDARAAERRRSFSAMTDALREEKSLARARDVVTMLGNAPALDPAEVDLCIDLLAPVLCADGYAARDAGAVGELCGTLQRHVGRAIPWAEVSVAAMEIRRDRAFAAASQRLAQPDVAAQPLARALAWACARLDPSSPASQVTTADARGLVAELERAFPLWTERPALRAALLRELRAAGSWHEYREEASAWMADPAVERTVAVSEPDRRVTRDSIATVAENLSVAECGSLVAAARPGVRALPELAALATLLQTPDEFATPETARACRDRLDVRALAFSRPLAAAALAAHARAADAAGIPASLEAVAGSLAAAADAVAAWEAPELPGAETLAAVRDALGSARGSSPAGRFRSVAATIEALAAIVDRLAGLRDAAAPWPSRDASTDDPDWFRWLLARTASLRADGGSGGRAFADREPAHVEGLGDIVGRIDETDRRVSALVFSGRRALEGGDLPAAGSHFDEATAMLATAPALVRLAWAPALDYFSAVLAARLGHADGAARLGAVTHPTFASDAAAQLALLSIRAADLESADAHLARASSPSPAADYARVLLAARRGDDAEARRRAEALSQSPAASAGPYRRAAERMLAALDERAGQEALAEQRLRAVLAESPADVVASARLGRLLTRHALRGWAGAGDASSGAAPPDPSPLLDVARDRVPWCRAYADLAAALAPGPGTGDAGENLARPSSPPAAREAWQRVEMQTHVRRGHWSAALALVGATDAGSPAWRRAAQATLGGFDVMYRIGRLTAAAQPDAAARDAARAELRAHREVLRSLPQQTADGRLTSSAHALALFDATDAALADEGARLPAESFAVFAPSPLSRLPLLFSGDGDARAAAGAELGAAVFGASVAGWSHAQRRLVAAVSAAALARDDDYLVHYAELSSDLAAWPVAGVDLWLAAAGAWRRKRNWRLMLDRALPDAIADLSDPRVGLELALGHAAAAHSDAVRGELPRALQRLEQARTFLAPLLTSSATTMSHT
jgi:hypothetical protein